MRDSGQEDGAGTRNSTEVMYLRVFPCIRRKGQTEANAHPGFGPGSTGEHSQRKIREDPEPAYPYAWPAHSLDRLVQIMDR